MIEKGVISRAGRTKHINVLDRVEVVRHLKTGRERLQQFQVEEINEARLAFDSIGRELEQVLGASTRFVDKGD